MFNKLVMESVDTQQHSTELLDNLQNRTFDAFLLKAEPSCLLSARKHMTQVCLSGISTATKSMRYIGQSIP